MYYTNMISFDFPPEREKKNSNLVLAPTESFLGVGGGGNAICCYFFKVWDGAQKIVLYM